MRRCRDVVVLVDQPHLPDGKKYLVSLGYTR